MNASIFVGVSLDGFIARANGDLDWLPHGSGEDHGFTPFLASVDAIVMGRHTYEKVLTFGAWPYGDKLVVVLSSRELAPAPAGARVERRSGPPAEIAAQLAQRGLEHLYVDGGITTQQFLAAGLITRLTITTIPILIGSGIPLFGPTPRDIPLRHVATRTFPSGLVQSEYAATGR